MPFEKLIYFIRLMRVDGTVILTYSYLFVFLKIPAEIRNSSLFMPAETRLCVYLPVFPTKPEIIQFSDHAIIVAHFVGLC
jgi:hypothetical protein